MAAVTIYNDCGAPKSKVCHCFHCFPSICHEVTEPDAMSSFLECWTLRRLFTLLFHLIKRLFSCSSLSAIKVVLSAYLRLLICLLAILITACASSCLAFHMMYSAYKLNKQRDNIQPWHTPFLIWNQSVPSSNFCFLTCIQISQKAGQVVWYSHLLKNFPQFAVIHTVKGFGIVNKAEVDVFLELSYFFSDPMDIGNLISGSSVFSSPAWTSGTALRILTITLLASEMSAIVL